jgi:3-polyprenyl-4-hydroxybenzoate decarboxylase
MLILGVLVEADTTLDSKKSLSTGKVESLSLEEQIKMAMKDVKEVKIVKSSTPKIISTSKSLVLDSEKPKVKEKKKIAKKKKVHKKRKKRRVHKKRRKAMKKRHRAKKRVEKVDMDSIPLAQTYPMDVGTNTN